MPEIFFDVDGCLIDENYDANASQSEISKLIGNLIRQGFNLHLNSNRSIESLLTIRERFGFNGAIISENGILIFDPRTGEYLYKNGDFVELDRDLLVRTLGDQNNVLFTDTNSVARNPKRIAKLGLSKILFICEDTRRYTMTIYPRVFDLDNIVFDRDLLERTAQKISRVFPSYEVSIGEPYGNVLMIPKGANKGSSLRSFFDNSQIASFGDSIGDLPMLEVSDLCGAPSNAQEDVKARVKALKGYISPYAYTQGALDFLVKAREVLT